MAGREVAVFFYGSYMNLDVLREVDLVPTRAVAARLPGFAITIGPLANVTRSRKDTVHGLLTWATHSELDRLYAHAQDQLGGVYLPEAVLVQTEDGQPAVALCYIADELEPAPASADYVDRIVVPARELGFPAEYIAHLESFRPERA